MRESSTPKRNAKQNKTKENKMGHYPKGHTPCKNATKPFPCNFRTLGFKLKTGASERASERERAESESVRERDLEFPDAP